MRRPSPWEREAAKLTSEVARRAIRRLDILEWIIMAVAAALAIGGGGLVAMLVVGRSGAGFRGMWIATSLLLIVVPGALALARQRKDERSRNVEASGPGMEEDG